MLTGPYILAMFANPDGSKSEPFHDFIAPLTLGCLLLAFVLPRRWLVEIMLAETLAWILWCAGNYYLLAIHYSFNRLSRPDPGAFMPQYFCAGLAVIWATFALSWTLRRSIALRQRAVAQKFPAQ